MKKTTVTLLLLLMLILGVAVGGTVAWLVTDAQTVTNTFEAGNISITLQESKYDAAANQLTATVVSAGESQSYLFVPGATLPKNPTVTVKANSEKCYVFIKETVTGDILTYTLDGWTALDGKAGVYYQVVDKSTTDTVLNILTDQQVVVKTSAGNGSQASLTFEAAAVQFEHIGDAAAAYEQLPDAFKN